MPPFRQYLCPRRGGFGSLVRSPVRSLNLAARSPLGRTPGVCDYARRGRPVPRKEEDRKAEAEGLPRHDPTLRERDDLAQNPQRLF